MKLNARPSLAERLAASKEARLQGFKAKCQEAGDSVMARYKLQESRRLWIAAHLAIAPTDKGWYRVDQMQNTFTPISALEAYKANWYERFYVCETTPPASRERRRLVFGTVYEPNIIPGQPKSPVGYVTWMAKTATESAIAGQTSVKLRA
jgi:hypothetical protein